LNFWQRALVERGRTEAAGHSSKEIQKKSIFGACACCKHYTIPIDSEYEKCPVCGWIDDPYQNMHYDSTEGKNPISLNEAKKVYLVHHQ
jgi:hypothetical protein